MLRMAQSNGVQMMRFSKSLAAAAAFGFAAVTIGGAASAGEYSQRTKTNLEAAMHGEAYANLKYRAYAEKAREAGLNDIAMLFEEAANVEANEHFAREADALKLTKSTKANLLDAMAGEHYENTKMYKDFAKEAREDGDSSAARLFEQIAVDEGDHYEAYKGMLAQLPATAD